MQRSASIWSFIGRISDRMTSAEWADMYAGPDENIECHRGSTKYGGLRGYLDR